MPMAFTNRKPPQVRIDAEQIRESGIAQTVSGAAAAFAAWISPFSS